VAQRSGLVNIEGLANLSGPIHDKGVMILEGFLLQEFGGNEVCHASPFRSGG